MFSISDNLKKEIIGILIAFVYWLAY